MSDASAYNGRRNGDSFNIPKWFMVVMSGAMTLLVVGGIPWATWVTRTLSRVEIHAEGNSLQQAATNARIDKVATDLRDLERRFDRWGGTKSSE